MTARRVLRAALAVAAACTVSSCFARHGLRQESEWNETWAVLRWEPFVPPPEWSSDAALSPGRVLSVTYDLHVVDDLGRTLDRRGVEGNEFALTLWDARDESGEPRTIRWTVRPRLLTTRGTRLGPWSQSTDPGHEGRSPVVPLPANRMAVIRR